MKIKNYQNIPTPPPTGFVRTTAINKIARVQTRKKVIQGGTSAGKTFGILPLLINIALQSPGKEISVVSESVPHLRRGCIKDFKKIMVLTHRWREKEFNKSHLRYEFSNGSYIEFFSANEEARLRGARRNILYVNEANNIPFNAYHQLAIRTDQEIYIDFNPTAEFWAHTEVAPGDDAELIILTYKDNEALSQTIIDEIESAKEKGKTSSYWANWYRVYALGLVGNLDGVVFDNWKTIAELPRDPKTGELEAKLLGAGLDWGYTNDPTAVLNLYQWNGKIIVDEVLYKKGLHNREIAQILKETLPRGTEVIGDSAEPKSIDDVFNYGIQIYPAKKGPDSIRQGISLLQEYEILVTEQSLNLIRELRGYVWGKDREGKKENRPAVNCEDHLLDALRYVATAKLVNYTLNWSVR